MSDLFSPIQLGAIEAKNRILMAPLTRARATREHVPTPMMVEYYAQRAEAGLIISEGVGISRQGLGWPYAPGIWSDEQVEKWRPVTQAVHEKGGKIVAQLWHMGRMAHSSVTGQPIVSSSATRVDTKLHIYTGKEDAETARALTVAEIAQIVEDYGVAARNAMQAGFDGIQIHSANGYLLDEFLRSNSNFRDDEYGGAPENRIRFLKEATARIIKEIGAARTSVRLSPNGDTQGCFEPDPESVFVPAAKMLSDLGIGFLELREIGPEGTYGSTDQPKIHDAIRKVFNGPLILNSDYTRSQAIETVANGTADGIAFGRPFISNPDLVTRLQKDLPLAPWDIKTFYTQTEEGYTDYPTYGK